MSWIQTHAGLRFDYANPTSDMVCLEDIAHSLSHLCRFNGHGKTFYSVAQHSIHVSEYVPQSEQKRALLHDATEAYIGDIPKPLKEFLGIDVNALEKRIEQVIAARFGLDTLWSPVVKNMDRIMLVTERDFLFDNPLPWPSMADTKPISKHHIVPWTSERSKVEFLALAKELGID